MKKKIAMRLAAVVLVCVLTLSLGVLNAYASEDAPSVVSTASDSASASGDADSAVSADSADSTVAFVYDPQPADADEVEALIEAYLEDPEANPFPKWAEAIDASWIPAGLEQKQLTDEETGAVYYTLAPMGPVVIAPRAAVTGASVTINSVQDLEDTLAALDCNKTIYLSSSFVSDLASKQVVATIPVGNLYNVVIDGNNQVLSTSVGGAMFDIANKSASKVTFRNMTLNSAFNFSLNDKVGVNTASSFELDNVEMIGGNNRAVYVQNCTFTMNNCLVKDKVRGASNGAVLLNTSVQGTITNCTFEGNVVDAAGYFGGAIATSVNASNQTLTIRNSYFKGNKALQGGTGTAGGGGAITFYGAISGANKLTVDNCVFTENESGGNTKRSDGGAIMLMGNADNYYITFEITNSTFENNSAGDDGAAILIEGSSNRAVFNTNGTISNCTFTGNVATHSNQGSRGGAIQVYGSAKLTMTSSTFFNNSTRYNGRSIGLSGYANTSTGYDCVPAVTLTNNVFLESRTSATANRGNVSGYAINTLFVRLVVEGNLGITSGGGNIGLDSGSPLPTGLSAESVFGTSSPVLGVNGSSVVAGKTGQEVPVTTLYIAPNIGYLSLPASSTNISADNAGTGTAVADQRGFTRPGSPGLDAGAVEIVSTHFDAFENGGVWMAPTGSFSYATPVVYNAAANAKFAGVASDPGVPTTNAPPDPTKSGEVFLGWATSSGSTVPDYLPGAAVPVGTTYYAIYGIPLTVTFESNGGSSVPSQSVASGGLVTRPTNPTRPGYDFIGWYQEPALSTVWNFASDKVYSNITLYAKWQKTVPTATYRVMYDVNWGGLGTSQIPDDAGHFSGGVVTVKSDIPTRAGYTFTGWNTAADGSGTAYSGGNQFNIYSDVTLYAQWQPAGTTTSSSSQSVAPSSSSSIPPLTSSSSAPGGTSSIPDITTPEVNPQAHWALLNLLLWVFGAVVAIVVAVRKFFFGNKQEEPEDDGTYAASRAQNQAQQDDAANNKKPGRGWSLLSLGIAAAMAIVFFLTEDMRLPMAIVDQWTLLMAALFVGEAVTIVLALRNKRREDDDEEETPSPQY